MNSFSALEARKIAANLHEQHRECCKYAERHHAHHFRQKIRAYMSRRGSYSMRLLDRRKRRVYRMAVACYGTHTEPQYE